MESLFRVSICGGGIGGLTLALVVSKYGKLPVEIFEAGPTVTTVGAGISFFGRTMDIMTDLGLYDEIVKMAIQPPQENTGPTFRKSDQPDGFHWFSKDLKRGVISVHRKDLVDFLLRQLGDSCSVYTSKKLKHYDVHPQTGKITLHFSDGSHSLTDMLVGADGIHSVTRKVMYQNFASATQDETSRKTSSECVDPVWTGTLVYRGLVPVTKIREEYPTIELPTNISMFLGRKKHIVLYPISQGKLLNVVIFCHGSGASESSYEDGWVADVSEKEVTDQFESWETPAKALVKCVERPSRWALHNIRPLPYYVNGNVVLLGDAAHAMEPHFGAGAGQAMEDAYVPGRLLTHELTQRWNMSDALKTYEAVRLPFANSVVQRSRCIGRYYGLQHVDEDDSIDGKVRAEDSPDDLDRLRKSIEDAWEWQSESTSVWAEAEACWHTIVGKMG